MMNEAVRACRPRAVIMPGCSTAPDGLVGGLPRRTRLIRTLQKSGFEVVGESNDAELKIQDCHLPIGQEEIHLCAEGIPAVEKRLLASLRKPMALDGVICFLFTRRISLAITKRLMQRSVTPNQITILTLLLGISSGLVIARGSYWSGLVGTILLQMQAILDCTDGELARLKFQGSRLGEWLDTLSDDLAQLFLLIGTSLAVPVPSLRWMGTFAIFSQILTKAVIYHRLATVYRTGDLLAIQWHLGKAETIWTKIRFLYGHDFLCFSALLFAIAGRLDFALAFASFRAVSEFASLIWQLTRYGWQPAGGNR